MDNLLQAKKILSLLFAQLLICTAAIADDSTASDKYISERDWHYNISLVYSKRTLDGTIVNKTPIDDDVFGSLFSTGDSMNVGTSDEFMLAIGAYYKRWAIGLNYMPTSFSGTGSALVKVGSGSTGVIVATPLNTNIDVNMLLANVTYDFIKTGNNVFGIGAGLGNTSIDLAIIPGVGDSIIYNGNQPFGFLNIHMSSKHNSFSYGFSMNGISADFDGASVDYSQYTVNLGYRVKDGAVKLDVIGGYRLVNFAIDLQEGQNVIRADVALEGPYLGVNLAY
jgi:hypothetical protein